MEHKKIILKVLVGSKAHGLADEKSDTDYKAVYVLPTKKILSLGFRYKGTDWVEGNIDNTAYEISHFLHLATKCNPTILEVFKAPIAKFGGNSLFINSDGDRLRKLFPYIWNPKEAFDAFVGYGLNQRKKMLDKKDNRPNKYAVAYIRTLLALNQLLTTGSFDVKITNKVYKKMLLRYKEGNYTPGEVINEAEILIELAKDNLRKCKHEPDLEMINDFLLDMRKRYWEI